MSAVLPGREGPIVLVVAKAPVAGRVKTRLAAVIGPEGAAALGRAMLLDTLDGCRLEVPVVGVLKLSLEVRLLEPWRDVDTMDDVAALADGLETMPGRRTAAVLSRLFLPEPASHLL